MLLLKSDASHKTASFVILEPDTEDRNGDVISADEIVKTAHDFLWSLSEKYVNFNHTKDSETDEVQIVESWITPVKIKVGEGSIKIGSWIVAFKFLSDDLWEEFLAGEITGVSMEGKWSPKAS